MIQNIHPPEILTVTFESRGDNLVLSWPGCVCPKVKDMGPFLASTE